MDKLLTVVVPVYNAEAYLDECVQSILHQTYRSIELILVDDGSRDRSLSLCREWQDKDPRVRVIHQENKGPGAARNQGIEAAVGEYIAFVDSDDTVAPTMYERMLALAEEHDADMVCSKLLNNADDGTKLLILNREDALRNRLLAINISDSTVDKVYRRALFAEHRYPVDRSLSEDSALVYRLISDCQRVVYTSERFYQIRNTENSLSRSSYEKRFTQTIATYEEMVEFFRRSGEREFEKIAVQKAVGAVIFNAGEYCCAGCQDVEAKKIIKAHAKWQLKNYKLPGKQRILLYLTVFFFHGLGFIYKYKNRRKRL